MWEKGIAFYLDGVNFAYKTNPLDQARAPTGRIYRKKSEGLDQFCTAKGKKVGTGGKLVKFIVAISHDCGVILCEQYEHMNGSFFASFVDKHFRDLFEKCKKNTRLWKQDGDPSQNCRLAQDAMKRANANLLKIPPRSPDLNPIENVFKSISEILRRQVIDKAISYESYEDFAARVKSTIESFSVDKINKIIESMKTRIPLITKRKKRLKY